MQVILIARLLVMWAVVHPIFKVVEVGVVLVLVAAQVLAQALLVADPALVEPATAQILVALL
ncbi:unannotated protein [freshwater metagenome]|uniref:Unannotated protein n=1 Tax=freshwater metagenome TaxID=449393 RepID=A0A6J6Z491_9ZZZZ